MLSWKVHNSIFKASVLVTGGELFLQITCGQNWFLVQKLTYFRSFFKRQLGSEFQEQVELRGTLSEAFKWDISWRGYFQGVDCRQYENPWMLLEAGLKMKGGNKDLNAGRSEEFVLAGQGNTVPSPLQLSPEVPMFLSPHGLLWFSFTCLSLQDQSCIPWRFSWLLVPEFTQGMRWNKANLVLIALV